MGLWQSDGSRLQPKLCKYEKSHTGCMLTFYQMFFLPTLQLDGRRWVLQSGGLRIDFCACIQTYLSVTWFSDMLNSFRESQWSCWAAQQFGNSSSFLGNEHWFGDQISEPILVTDQFSNCLPLAVFKRFALVIVLKNHRQTPKYRSAIQILQNHRWHPWLPIQPAPALGAPLL